MMMEGYTMGIADMTKDIREYENTTASEASLKLAREVVNYYERCYDRMKKFL
jgi:predicted translin family RNA/ssDNA-binding protein